MIFALDSNILIYMTGIVRVPADEAKVEAVAAMVSHLADRVDLLAPLQALGETYVVLQRMGVTREAAKQLILNIEVDMLTAASTSACYDAAFDLATTHKLQFWDALILNVAAESGCVLLLSEDMQPGFVWRGVTVANPFADPLDRTLLKAMRG